MMSEKRFVIGDDNIAMFEVIDMEKEELVCECRAVDVETLVDLLNSLAEENEKLKKQLEIRTASDKYHQRMLTKWLCKNE